MPQSWKKGRNKQGIRARTHWRLGRQEVQRGSGGPGTRGKKAFRTVHDPHFSRVRCNLWSFLFVRLFSGIQRARLSFGSPHGGCKLAAGHSAYGKPAPRQRTTGAAGSGCGPCSPKFSAGDRGHSARGAANSRDSASRRFATPDRGEAQFESFSFTHSKCRPGVGGNNSAGCGSAHQAGCGSTG